jgi:uncharacterized membrane protein YgcG
MVFVLFSTPAAALADVDDFSFESFDARYELSLNVDANNRPEMLVTETLVAVFPEIDQNRGIKRDIPAYSYGDKPGLVELLSVTDEDGKPREFEETRDGEFVSVAIKAKDDSYVYGRQTYVIKYRQSWVIANYQATSGFDEFYWDVNGTGWQQSFDSVKATVVLDQALQDALVLDKASCFEGLAGSKIACDTTSITKEKLVFSTKALAAGENLTVAIPFAAGVANTEGPQVQGTPSWFANLASAAVLLAILIWAGFYRIYVIKPEGKKSFVVPQYQPAEEPGLVATAIIAKKTRHLLRALIVNLAIRGEIELEPVASSEADYLIRRTALASAGDQLLEGLGLLKSGDEFSFGANSQRAAGPELRLVESKLVSAKSAELIKAGYFRKRALGVPAMVFGLAVIVFSAWVFFALVLDAETAAGFTIWPILTLVPFSGIYWLLLSKRALSSKGSEVLTYLKGLEMYIELAESDRLAFLQSPKGASLKASEFGGKQVLKLYERVLPWAILLGLQKEWSAVLAVHSEQSGVPLTIAGGTILATNLSGLDAALTASIASSESGGSGGSGSSGGGGGGGGGSGI